MSRQRQAQPATVERERPQTAAEAAPAAEAESTPAASGPAHALHAPPPNPTAHRMRQASVRRLQRQLGNSGLGRALAPRAQAATGLLQRAPSLEELVVDAQQQVSDAEAEQEQAEPVEAEPVELPEVVPVDSGAGAGSGGGSVPAAEAAAPAEPAPAVPAGAADLAADGTTQAGARPAGAAGAEAAPTANVAPAEVGAGVAAGAGSSAEQTAVAGSIANAASTGADRATVAGGDTATSATAGAEQAAQQAASQSHAAATSAAGAPAPAGTEAAGEATGEAEAAQTPVAEGDETVPDEDEERPGPQRLIQRKVAPASPAEDPAFQAVVGKVKGAAAGQKAHEPPAAKAAQAAGAAQMPPQERAGLAQGQQTAAVAATAAAQQARAGGGQAPGFNKGAFVASVKAKIDELTPKDPKQMENIEGSGVFGGAKQAVDEKVRTGKDEAQGGVDDKVKETPDPAAVPERPTTPLAPNQPGAPPAVEAAGAAPKAKGVEQVEAPLQAGSQQIDAQMASSNVTPEQLQQSNEPGFQAALAARQEAQAHAASAPAAYRAGEQAGVAGAQAGATAAAQEGVAGMHAGRSRVFGQMDGLQSGARGRDEGKRAAIGREIDARFNAAKRDVESILGALDTAVEAEFNRGADAAKSKAVDYIKRETQAYKDRRYNRDAAWYDVGAHVGGALTHVGDAITGMPDEYYQYFRQGRDLYCAEMEAVIGRVADIVADHLGRARQRIEQGKAEINEFVASQPAALREVAQEAAGEALGRFSELEQSVDSKQQEVVDNLAQQYVEKLQALDSELEQMKEADKGLVAKATDAIAGVVNTIRELTALLEGALQRAAAAIPLIIRDPIGFLGNLIAGIGQGLRAFVGNIGSHLQQGLVSWLTGAIGSAGITLPQSFDLPGIFSLVLQLLGLTWANIRARIVQGLGPQGERIMGALEQAWEVIQIIRSGGLAGLWTYVSGMVGDIKEMVLGQIKEMVISQVIKAGVDWLIGILGGPAGAFVKAAQGIVRVVSWFMANGSRVLSLVNSVLDSVVAIASGNVAGAARFIEQSLAQALPTVISFLADLLGLGGISRKVQEIIKKVQAPVGKAIDWVVKKAKALGKRLLGAIGGRRGGGKGDPQEEQERLRRGVMAGVGAVNRLGGNWLSESMIRPVLGAIKIRYRLGLLEPVVEQDRWAVHGEIQRIKAFSNKKPDDGKRRKQDGSITEPTLPPKEIVAQNGVSIVHYTKSGDHGPAHFHVLGGGPETKIGQNGKAIDGSPNPTPQQQDVIDDNKSVIRSAAKKIMAYFRYNNQ